MKWEKNFFLPPPIFLFTTPLFTVVASCMVVYTHTHTHTQHSIMWYKLQPISHITCVKSSIPSQILWFYFLLILKIYWNWNRSREKAETLGNKFLLCFAASTFRIPLTLAHTSLETFSYTFCSFECKEKIFHFLSIALKYAHTFHFSME